MSRRDPVDDLMAQWAGERPDVDHTVMASIGRLLRVALEIDRRFEAHAGRHGVTRAEADVLFSLRRAGPPYRRSPGRLTAALLVASGTMTARLDRLERKGLVRRRPNPEDRRSLVVELTEAGLALTDAVVGPHVEQEQEMLAVLSASEREELDRLLRKLLAHVSGMAL